MITYNKLKVNKIYFCTWNNRCVQYAGRAYNAKDYEFIDINNPRNSDAVLVFSKSEVEIYIHEL